MAAHPRIALLLLVLVGIVGLCGCSGGADPVSPSSTSAATAQLAGAKAVGLTGVVSDLNQNTRALSLAMRGGARLVTTDAATIVWSQATNSQVRFSALKNGQTVAVRGTDETRYVLARSIVIVR